MDPGVGYMSVSYVRLYNFNYINIFQNLKEYTQSELFINA